MQEHWGHVRGRITRGEKRPITLTYAKTKFMSFNEPIGRGGKTRLHRFKGSCLAPQGRGTTTQPKRGKTRRGAVLRANSGYRSNANSGISIRGVKTPAGPPRALGEKNPRGMPTRFVGGYEIRKERNFDPQEQRGETMGSVELNPRVACRREKHTVVASQPHCSHEPGGGVGTIRHNNRDPQHGCPSDRGTKSQKKEMGLQFTRKSDTFEQRRTQRMNRKIRMSCCQCGLPTLKTLLCLYF